MTLLYVCVLDTIYGLVTKKIAVGNLRKIIVTPQIIIYKNRWGFQGFKAVKMVNMDAISIGKPGRRT